MRTSVRRTFLRVTAAAAVALLPAVAAPAAEGDVETTSLLGHPGGDSFYETFDGPLDETFWYVADAFRNGSYQNCQFNAANTVVADGLLQLSLDDTPYGDQDYSCGSIQTREWHGYGTYETRMRVGAASGTNSSLFTYTGPTYGEPWHEIDVEILGHDTTAVEFNSWVDGAAAGGGPVPVGVDNAAEFVDYAFVWEPDRLQFFIDGEVARTYTDPSDLPTYTQRVFLMIWGTDTLTDWMGPFEYPGAPIVTEYDHVAFTALGDECPFEGSLACGLEAPTTSFVDDMDTLDTSRWFVSDGWNNGDAYACGWDADQVSAVDGALELTFAAGAVAGRDYACAEVQHRTPLGYGTYEVRAQGVENPGVLASIFTYAAAGDDGPAEGIDLARLLGADTDTVRLSTSRYHQQMVSTSAPLIPGADEAFHDYGIVWSADRLDFYVDGELVHAVTDPAKIPVRDAKLFLSLWGGTVPGGGELVPPDVPLTMRVDRVAYTAPGESCQFTGSIVCTAAASTA